jgi:hypothetical protein
MKPMNVHDGDMTRRDFCAALAAAGAVAAAGMALPSPTGEAYADGTAAVDGGSAAQSPDAVSLASFDEGPLFLGAFFDYDDEGETKWHNVLATSRDGRLFEQIGIPYTSEQNAFTCPGLFWHGGFFWLLAGWNRNDGKFWPVLGFSPDLREWCVPENRGGIEMVECPFGMEDFDTVAPDAFVDDDGSLYMVFAAGYYGAFHGEPENDRMLPYIVRMGELIADGIQRGGETKAGQHYAEGFKFCESAPARPLYLPGNESGNRIDCSLFKEGGTYYLCVKRDGVVNEIYANAALSAWGWKQVADGLAVGTEGPCLTAADGVWRLYTDKISTWPPSEIQANGRLGDGVTGLRVSTAGDPAGPWSDAEEVVCIDRARDRVHVRHGTVLRIDDPAAIAVVEAARAAAGWEELDAPRSWFSDVSASDWSRDGIYRCADAGLMSGYSGTTLFGKADVMTRAQFATVLWRAAEPAGAAGYERSETPNATGMPDVADCVWYTGAANWAVANGVVNGSGGRFMPDEPMTFEQMVAMLYNLRGGDAPQDESPLDRFRDASDVSPWARSPMAWGVANGVVSGYDEASGRYLRPGELVQRQRAACIVANCLLA